MRFVGGEKGTTTGFVSESSVAPIRYDCRKFRIRPFAVPGSFGGPDQGIGLSTSPHSENKELAPSVTQVSYPVTLTDKMEMLSYRGVMDASDDSDSDTHFTP